MKSRKQEDDEYSEESVAVHSNRKLYKMEGMSNPLQIRVLNLSNNHISLLKDIQLW
jgi:hypothetical protein